MHAVSSPNHTVSSSVYVSTKVYHTIEKKHHFFKCNFSYDQITPLSIPLDLLKAASFFFANAENCTTRRGVHYNWGVSSSEQLAKTLITLEPHGIF